MARWFVDNDVAMIVTTVFFLAYLPPSHGLAVNGLWLAPGFTPKLLSYKLLRALHVSLEKAATQQLKRDAA